MKNHHEIFLASLGLMAWLLAVSTLTPDRTALASHTPCVGGPSVCGQNSGLVPFKKDAIGATLHWRDSSNSKWKAECPKMLIWMRPSEYKPNDYTLTGVDANGQPIFGGFNPNYLNLVQGVNQGGPNLGNLDQSGWSRYAPDRDRENTQLIDVCGLQDEIANGVFNKATIPELTDADMSLSDPYFEDAGFSKGLGYNIFCLGHVAGVDGRSYHFGQHDKQGNNGGAKVNIFDPKKEEWVSRTLPCTRTEWEVDPTGTFPHCNPLDEANTSPLDLSDMKYKRWYPTAVTLPDGRILILSGSDTVQGAPVPLIRQPVPEIYDPKTDRTVALENAQKFLPMYPRAHVVQTGPGENDWKVCSLGEVVTRVGGGYDPFQLDGRTSCLDVLGALADPDRDVPATKHWTLVDTALNAHDSGAGVMMVTINWDGTWSQEQWVFGGSNNAGPNSGNVATVEKINWAAAAPQWQQQTDLHQVATQNNVVALPTGDMLIVGGRSGGALGNSLQYQMFRQNGSRTDLIISNVPRHDHSTALAVLDGSVFVMGGNRTDLLPAAQRNQSVPVLEVYKLPYFFNGPRPVIEKAPGKIHYGQTFNLEVAGDEIGAVAILRTGPITHNWAWGNQYVKLPFQKDKKYGRLEVKAPHLPGLAIAGDYILFVVSEDGVPSLGQRIQIKLDGSD